MDNIEPTYNGGFTLRPLHDQLHQGHIQTEEYKFTLEYFPKLQYFNRYLVGELCYGEGIFLQQLMLHKFLFSIKNV